MKFCYTLQHGWTLKSLCREKEARYKRPYVVWFHLHGMSRTGKSGDRKQTSVCQGLGGGGSLLNGYGISISIWDDEISLELDRGDDCTTPCMYQCHTFTLSKELRGDPGPQWVSPSPYTKVVVQGTGEATNVCTNRWDNTSMFPSLSLSNHYFFSKMC